MALSDGRNFFVPRENGNLYLDCSKEKEGRKGKGKVSMFAKASHLSPAFTQCSGKELHL